MKKIARITQDTLICGIDIGKSKCCAIVIEKLRCIINYDLIEQKILV